MTVQTTQANPVDLSAMAAKWPSAIVARKSIGDFTGGLLKTTTMANIDKEIPKFKKGSKVYYMATELVKWLEGETSIVEPKKTVEQLLEEKFERKRLAREKR